MAITRGAGYQSPIDIFRKPKSNAYSTAPDSFRAPGVAANPVATNLKPTGARTPAAAAPSPAPAVSYGGGGGGGGSAAAPVAPAAPKMSFDDFIAKDFGYKQTKNENSRRLQDYDAESLLLQQQTESEQDMRRTALEETLQQMGGDWANDAANRGILRSGLYLQGQDQVDQQGVEGNQDIDQLLTNLQSKRSTGRVAQEAANRNALNDVLSQLSEKFNSGLAIQ